MSPTTFPLRTERLELRPFNDDDLDALREMQGHEEVTRYLPWSPQSRDEVLRLLGRIKPMTTVDASGDGTRLAAVLPDSGAVVGDFSLWRTSREHAQGEIGFVVHPDHQRRGYATEACTALLRLGFEQLGLHRIKGEWTDEVIFAALAHECRGPG